MKNHHIAGTALALILGAFPLTSALADDPAPPDDAGAEAATDTVLEPVSKTIEWVEGWEAGQAAATERGKLMLVYVHRTSPP